MTVREAARRLEVSSSTVYALLGQRKLKAYRIGIGRGTYRISEEDLQEYLTGARPDPPAVPTPRSRPLKHLRLS